MATVKSIVTKWGFTIDTKPLEKMKASVAELKAGIAAIAIEAGAAAVTLFETAETTAKLGKEASLAAQRTGLGVEAYQGLAFAAKKAGVDSEQLTIAMAHLNRTVFEAKTGSKEAMKSFLQLGGGVAQAAIKGAPTQEVFYKIADRIKSIQDPAAKTALAMQIFGRAGFQLLPVLNKGSAGLKEMSDEAKEMGLILDKNAVEASKNFIESLEDVEGLIVGIKRTVGVSLLEPFTEVFQSFSKWIRLNRDLIKQNIAGFFKGLASILKVTLSVSSALIGRISELAKPLGGLGAAAKYAFEAFALFQGFKIISGLGLAAQAVWGLGAAFKGLEVAEIGADLAAVAIPAAIGIAIIAVIALIEDLVGFFQGKDSLIGRFLEMFKTELPGVFKFLGGFIDSVVEKFKAFWGIAKVVFDGISSGVDATKRFFGGGDTPAAPIAGPGGALDFGGPRANSSSLGFGSPAQSPNISTSVTVNVPPGTDPNLVGDRVQDGVSKSLDNILRPANRALIPGVAY